MNAIHSARLQLRDRIQMEVLMRTKKAIRVTATHTAGQPTRTVVSGFPHIPGKTMQEKYAYMQEHADWLRTMICQEPRGSDIMSGAILTAPCEPAADIGVLHFEAAGWLPMCGHNTIGVCAAIVEEGLVEVTEPVTKIVLETPIGLIHADVSVKDGSAVRVSFRNTPSFPLVQNAIVHTDTWGAVPVDIGWGGSAVAFVPAEILGREICRENASYYETIGCELRSLINQQIPIHHPQLPDIHSISHVAFYADEPVMRHVVVGPDGRCDRSPCGNGSCARAALLHAQGRLQVGETFEQRSVIDSAFVCKCVEATMTGSTPAIIPEISGQAWITSFSTYIMDETDPFGTGFSLTL